MRRTRCTAGGKWLELLKESVTRVAVLRDPISSPGIGQFGAIQTAATSVGKPGQRARSQRDRAPGRSLCALPEWWFDRDGKRRSRASSNSHRPPYKLPRAVEFVANVPITGSGKIMRRLLKDVDDGTRIASERRETGLSRMPCLFAETDQA
jgi:acyl-CoA synthetase (AMP-forming)/AMP-acid ligase II